MKSDRDAWFAAKGQNTDQEPATLGETSSLKDYLHGITSPPAAAKRLMNTDESVRSLSDKVDRVSWLLFDAAIEFEPQQVAILDLVEAIHSLSDHDIPLSLEQKDRYPGWESWKKLERFKDLLDEMRRCGSFFLATSSGTRSINVLLNLAYWAFRATPDEDDDDPYECCRRWANMNAFLARSYLYYQEPSLLLMFGTLTVKTALEQEPPTQDTAGAGRPSTFEVHIIHYPNMLSSNLPYSSCKVINQCNNPTDRAS